jgi:lysophospholipase L1-like esterase
MEQLDYQSQSTALRNLGRFYLAEERQARMFTFSASGFEVGFIGTSVSAELIATECGRPQGEAAVAIVIDDMPFQEAKKITLNRSDAVYVLAQGLPLGYHRVRLYKRTESACSLTGWKKVMTDGNFAPLRERPTLKIEIYGDSITAGNGVEGIEGDDTFETRTENALISYGALASEKLKADFSLIAIGGYAVYRSPWNSEAPIKSIPQMFSFADCTWATDLHNAIPWDHALYHPDVVVINLGTNDDQYLLPLPEAERAKEMANFQKAMKEFIDQIRNTYRNCKVIVAIGMIKVTLCEKLLHEVVALYPQGVYFLPLHSLKVGGYMANGGHPNRAMHIEAGEELYQAIQSIISKENR